MRSQKSLAEPSWFAREFLLHASEESPTPDDDELPGLPSLPSSRRLAVAEPKPIAATPIGTLPAHLATRCLLVPGLTRKSKAWTRLNVEGLRKGHILG